MSTLLTCRSVDISWLCSCVRHLSTPTDGANDLYHVHCHLSDDRDQEALFLGLFPLSFSLKRKALSKLNMLGIIVHCCIIYRPQRRSFLDATFANMLWFDHRWTRNPKSDEISISGEIKPTSPALRMSAVVFGGSLRSTFAFLKVKRENVIVRKRRRRKMVSWLRISKQPEHEKCPIGRYFIHPVTQGSWGLSPMRSDGKGYHSNGVVSWPWMSTDTYTSAPPLSWNPPSLHAYLFQATGVPTRVIFPDFDWHTRGATDHN